MLNDRPGMKSMMKVSIRKIIIFLLVLSSLVPDIGIKVSTLGFNWTFYRTAVFVCILLYLQGPKNTGRVVIRSSYRSWRMFLAVWLIYGISLMILSPYRNLHNGFVELLAVFNGAVCMYLLVSSVRKETDLEEIAGIIFYVCIVLTVFGIFEILTGFHLPTSYFNSADAAHVTGRTKCATGIFYNENDFSSFLTCFAPIVLYSKKRRILSAFCFIGIIYINHMNDANICILAMIVGAVFYFVFIRQYGRRNQHVVRCIIALGVAIAAVMIWKNIDYLSNNNTLLYVIRTQQLNAENAHGSLYIRLVMYIDSVRAAMDTRFLGIGPASFMNYFTAHPSASKLVDPHNMYFEVLVEYGLVIMVAFAGCLFRLIIVFRKKILRAYDKNIHRKLTVGCEMIVLYCIVCIAPSSFIGYAWQWVVITFGILLVGLPEKELSERTSHIKICVNKTGKYLVQDNPKI